MADMFSCFRNWTLLASWLRYDSFVQLREALLTSSALLKVTACPFPNDGVKNLKTEVVRSAETSGNGLRRETSDRNDHNNRLQISAATSDGGGIQKFIWVSPRWVPCRSGAQPRSDGDCQNKSTRGAELPGASRHTEYVEDKLCFIGRSLRQGFGGPSNARPNHQNDRGTGPPTLSRSCGRLTRAMRKDKPGVVVTAQVLFGWQSTPRPESATRNEDQSQQN